MSVDPNLSPISNTLMYGLRRILLHLDHLMSLSLWRTVSV